MQNRSSLAVSRGALVLVIGLAACGLRAVPGLGGSPREPVAATPAATLAPDPAGAVAPGSGVGVGVGVGTEPKDAAVLRVSEPS